MLHHQSHRLGRLGANLFARPFDVPVEVLTRFHGHADFPGYTATNPLEDERNGLFLLTTTLIRHLRFSFFRPTEANHPADRPCLFT